MSRGGACGRGRSPCGATAHAVGGFPFFFFWSCVSLAGRGCSPLGAEIAMAVAVAALRQAHCQRARPCNGLFAHGGVWGESGATAGRWRSVVGRSCGGSPRRRRAASAATHAVAVCGRRRRRARRRRRVRCRCRSRRRHRSQAAAAAAVACNRGAPFGQRRVLMLCRSSCGAHLALCPALAPCGVSSPSAGAVAMPTSQGPPAGAPPHPRDQSFAHFWHTFLAHR